VNDKSTKKSQDIVDWADKKGENSFDLSNKIEIVAKSISPEDGSWALRKVLAANLIDWPDKIPVIDKISAAHVSSDTWYRVMTKPEYAAASLKWAKRLFGAAAGPVAISFLKNATVEGDVKAQIAYLQTVTVLDKAAGNTTNLNVGINITVEEIEEQRTTNQRVGLSRLGLFMPQGENQN
jgi:hypothetical protein